MIFYSGKEINSHFDETLSSLSNGLTSLYDSIGRLAVKKPGSELQQAYDVLGNMLGEVLEAANPVAKTTLHCG